MSTDWRRRKVGELRVVTIHHDDGTEYNRLVLEELVSDLVASIEGFYRNPPWRADGSSAPRVTHATVTKLTLNNASWWTHDSVSDAPPDDSEEVQVLWASPEQEAKWKAESLPSNETEAERHQDDPERN